MRWSSSVLNAICRWLWIPGRASLARDDVEKAVAIANFRFNVQTATPMSSPGLTGRSSIPETLVLEPRDRGVLDAPHVRGMTGEGDESLRSRGTKCPSCWKRTALEIKRGRRECRMRVAPVAACAAKSTGVSNYRYTATTGIPCAMVLTVSFVLFPVTMLGCHRHQRIVPLT